MWGFMLAGLGIVLLGVAIALLITEGRPRG